MEDQDAWNDEVPPAEEAPSDEDRDFETLMQTALNGPKEERYEAAELISMTCGDLTPDHLDALLDILHQYLGRDAEDAEEAEYVENIGLAVNHLLSLSEESRRVFAEKGSIQVGVHLVQTTLRRLGWKLVNSGIEGSSVSCNAFIEQGGLKYLFPALMRAPPKKSLVFLSILVQLARHTTGTCTARLINKFTEKRFQALHKVITLIDQSDSAVLLTLLMNLGNRAFRIMLLDQLKDAKKPFFQGLDDHLEFLAQPAEPDNGVDGKKGENEPSEEALLFGVYRQRILEDAQVS